MLNKPKNLSIERKFFISMLVSTVGVIVILLLTTNIIFYYNFTKNESSASKKQLDYISSQLDFFLSSADNYSKTIIADPVIQDYALQHKKDENFDVTTYSTLLESTINHVIQSTDYIHAVTLYDSNGDYLCSTNKHSKHQSAPPNSENPYGTWASTMQSSEVSSKQQISVLALARPFFSYVTGEQLGYLEISIPETSIAAIYKSQITNSSTVFITDNTGYIKSTVNYLSIDTLVPNFEKIDLQEDFLSYFSQTAVIFGRPVPALDWYIFSKTDMHFFFLPTYVSVIIFVAISSLCILLYAALAQRLSISITAPLHALIAHTKTIKRGDWSPLPLEIAASDQDTLLLFQSFNSMIISQKNLKNELLETQKVKNKLSLDLLHQQINPHFLYNTLDNICSLAEIGERETLIEIVMNLSTFYRQTLSSGRAYITLGEELTLTRAYLQIMQIRYFEKFDFTITCDDALLSCECIKLLLQPIVENSIYHGIKEIDHHGQLTIDISADEAHLHIIISDNGVGLSDASHKSLFDQTQSHFGIQSIQRRIQLYYGPDYGLTMSNAPSGGCITTIIIPKRRVSL